MDNLAKAVRASAARGPFPGAVAKLGQQAEHRGMITVMGTFSGRHFPREVILWVVRYYFRYGVSCRDLEEMMTERGV